MKFAFLIMGEFDSSKDYASIHENEAQMIGVASIEEARNVARKLQEEGVDCIAYCGDRYARLAHNGWIQMAISTKRLTSFGLVSMLDLVLCHDLVQVKMRFSPS